MTEEKLRTLLEQAEEVGCYKRDWQETVEICEAVRCGQTHGSHPYYEREMQAEESAYRKARAALYAAVGIPEKEEPGSEEAPPGRR